MRLGLVVIGTTIGKGKVMARDTRAFSDGTSLTQDYPFGWYVTGRAMCTDGKVRTLKRISATADTFFSVPASVTVDGKTVSGFITTDRYGSDGEPRVTFIAHRYGRNGHLLPLLASETAP